MKTFSRIPSEKNSREIPCSLCGAENHRLLWQFDGWQYVKCRSCGLVYQSPQPVADELVERYDGEYCSYELENQEAFFNLMLLGLRDAGFYRLESKLLADSSDNPESEPLSFIDVGCATGKLVEYMQNRGWNSSGIEVCESAAQYGIEHRGVSIHIGPAESSGINDSSVDLIHCSHLIEHLNNPDAYLKWCFRVLKPGGHLIVVTPDISGMQAVLFGHEWRSAIADHMYLFSGRTLRRMLEKNGFKIKKQKTWGGLAAGTAPLPLKKAADKLVKFTGWGDVVCILATKAA